VAGVNLMATIRGGGGPLGMHTATRTGEDGRFMVEGLPQGAGVLFHPAGDPVWVGLHIERNNTNSKVVVGRAVAEVEAPLLRRGAVEGVVRGPGGEPVVGARVWALGALRNWSSVSVSANLGEARSDRLGRFRLDGIAPGRILLLARAGNLIPPGIPEQREMFEIFGRGADSPHAVEVKSGLAVQREIRLVTGVTVSGRVLHPDGRPARGATVYTRNRYIGSSVAGVTETDSAGFFRLEGVPAEGEPLLIGAGSADARAASEPLSPGPDHEVSGIVLRLNSTQASISGVVLTPEGAAAVGARIYQVQRDREVPPFETPQGTATVVATNGSFRIGQISVWQSPRTVRLAAVAPGWLPGVADIEVAAGQAVKDVRVTLARGVSLEGRIEHPNGSPAVGVPVGVFVDPSGSSRPQLLPEPLSVTGEDGEFTLAPVPPDTRLCLCVGPVHGRVQLEREVRADGDPVVIALDLLTTVRGVARFADGTPAAGAAVCLMGPGRLRHDTRQTVTGPDGAFEFRAVPRGTFRLQFSAGAFVQLHTAPYPAGTEIVEVTLERGLTITGTVIDADGTPVASAGEAGGSRRGDPRHPDRGGQPGTRDLGPDRGRRRSPGPRDDGPAHPRRIHPGTPVRS